MRKKMFYEDPNVTKIHDGIYLYKNYISKNEVERYISELNEYEEDRWFQHSDYEDGDMAGDWWDGKISPDIILDDFHDKLINYFAPEFWLFKHRNFLRLKTGEKSQHENYRGNIESKYKIAIYCNDFSGGELVFSHLKIRYKPEFGDMIIFENNKLYEHYTDVVTQGTRYVYMDYLVEHPRYFMP